MLSSQAESRSSKHRPCNTWVWILGLSFLGLNLPLWATEVRARDCIEYRKYIHLEGSVETQDGRDVAVRGQYAYVANEGYDVPAILDVIDVSDVAHPVIVGSAEIPGGTALHRGIALKDDYAFVTARDLPISLLCVFDISDPFSPTLVTSLETPLGAHGVFVAGDRAYVAGADGIHVIDVSDPASPLLVGSVEAWEVRRIVVQGNYAYAAAGSGLLVLNISDPHDPWLVTTVGVDEDVADVVVAGDYAYVADSDIHNPHEPSLKVFDISDPASPSLVVSEESAPASGLALDGHDLHLVGRFPQTFHTYDISNGTDPVWVGSALTGGIHVAAAGGYAYAICRTGLQIVNVTNPSSPPVVGRVEVPYSYGVDVEGTYAYVASYSTSFLYIVDVSDPNAPFIVGAVDRVGIGWNVDVDGSYAYVAEWVLGLYSVDVSDPHSPQIAGYVDLIGEALDVVKVGDYAYLANGTRGLAIIDASDPTSLSVMGTLDTPGTGRGVEVAGHLAYLADDNSGLQIIDVSNPASPSLVSSVDVIDAKDVALSGIYAYVTGYSGLYVVDISDPTSPVFVGSCAGGGYDLLVDDGFAYVQDRVGTLRVFDLSTPDSPQFYSWVNLGEWASGLDSEGDYLFLTLDDSGLAILPKQCESVASAEDGGLQTRGAGLRLGISPNPASPVTTISFETSRDAWVALGIYDPSGRLVRTLVDARLTPDLHTILWDGRSRRGSLLPSGVYFCRLHVEGEGSLSRKLILIP